MLLEGFTVDAHLEAPVTTGRHGFWETARHLESTLVIIGSVSPQSTLSTLSTLQR